MFIIYFFKVASVMGLVPCLATCHISRIVVLFMHTVLFVANKILYLSRSRLHFKGDLQNNGEKFQNNSKVP